MTHTIKRPAGKCTLIKQDFETAFKQVDVIVTPTSPTAAFQGRRKPDPWQLDFIFIIIITDNIVMHSNTVVLAKKRTVFDVVNTCASPTTTPEYIYRAA